MIEWGTGAAKQQVECLTRHDEQVMELRLSKRRGPNLPASVMLEEPSAIEYARLRKAALAADAEVNDKFPRPDEPPDEIPDETDEQKAARFGEYAKAMAEWLNDRHNYRTDEDHAPYAQVVVQAVNMLTDNEITLADLTPECFKAQPMQGLLEVWETPLGGVVSPDETTETAPTENVSARTEPSVEQSPSVETPEADSPESTRSSPPGGQPSLPQESPPPSSTT